MVSVARADDGDADGVRERAMRSPILVGTGAALATIGGVAVPFGGLMLILPKPQPDCVGCGIDYTSRDTVAAAITLGGVAALASGITMMVYGAHRVPVTVSPTGPMGSSGFTLAVKF